MTRPQNIKGALNGFLGTFTSRYSDYKGYWLFGMLARDVDQLSVNLLDPGEIVSGADPKSTVTQLASQKFAEQLAKAGLTISSLREATLDIATRKEAVMGVVNGKTSEGRNVHLRVRVLYKSGKEYESNKLIFVAPHNPEIEQRSARSI